MIAHELGRHADRLSHGPCINEMRMSRPLAAEQLDHTDGDPLDDDVKHKVIAVHR